MVRKYDVEEANRGNSIAYWLALILIAACWILAFKCYFRSYENQHPDIAWAAPGSNRRTEQAEGLFLWDETVLSAPVAGKVYYPHGEGPVRVSSGQTVAKIVSASGAEKYVRAFQQGYFVAGTDGNEGKWRYSLLWPELKEDLPEISPVTLHHDGDAVEEGAAIGKMIPQPQNLRFIGLVDKDSVLNRQLKKQHLRLMMDSEDTPLLTDISISVDSGKKVKFLVTVPWFEPSVVLNRRGFVTAESGRLEGAVIPRSAVVKRRNVQGVYLVRGTRVFFKEIKGELTEDDKFIVTEGVFAGDAIVEDAEKTKEGRIQVW